MPPGADEVLAESGAQLAEHVVAAVPGWVRDCVAAVLERAAVPFSAALQAQADAAGRRAAAWAGEQLDAVLGADVDAQWATPLQILRGAVAFPTEVLRQTGVAPVARDRFAEERFPEDRYGLAPASLTVLGPEVGQLALTWGAAKAAAHRARHRPPGPGGTSG